jgi:O-antigen ligase
LIDERILMWFVLTHVAIGVLVAASPSMAPLHFWVTAGLAAFLASSATRPVDIAVIAAYVAGAEVLWRMREAAPFWETGKYALTAVLLVGLVRFRHSQSVRMPLVYFALLTPAIMQLAGAAISVERARDVISFNLSGPLALTAAICFFRQWTLSKTDVAEIFVALLGPVISIAVLTAVATYTSTEIAFTDQSNAQTSGGFGPNQVSGALSAGALGCFLVLAISDRLRPRIRALLFATLVVCATQSAMTFSRGGLYMAGISIAGASLCLLGDRAGRRTVVASAVTLVLAYLVIAPQLFAFTGGALETRFKNTASTGRVDLSIDELQMWTNQPVFGVGVGQLSAHRALSRATAAHNEWTRLLAEHGLLGLLSLMILVGMLGAAVLRARGPLAKAVALGCVLWGTAYLTVNDMRIAAPSFLLGLSCSAFDFTPRAASWRRRVVPGS